ncbi:MAG: Verru_Chthon cassette protein A [Methylacidiphilales bacterium]|nr:Verru_Chthon cassette protein A [Candidatus Methylacidiphilales bacterium]
MKPSPHRPFPFRRKGRRSAALVLILGCLVILTIVIVAFLSSVKTELNGSKTYADNAHVRTLMNTCVNLVYAQIRQATTTTPTDCWTSQPGLIRTFNNSGTPDMSYKLYSSATMQVSGALVPATEEATIPSSWNTQTAVYTDLNDPVSGVYPIVDPNVLTNSAPVQGFSIDSSAPTTTNQAAPMPVQWLYVLSNGALVSPTMTGTGTTATIAGASASNPIVGRIAFWTDDETCKVNINTASEGGTFNGTQTTSGVSPNVGTNTVSWDIPHFNNTVDENLGLYQPLENEFQNFPGHPAGVSLSTVFPSLVVSGSAGSAFTNFYTISPRIRNGGSYSGTIVVSTNTLPVTTGGDRLYDSVDELLFNPSRTANPTSSSSNTLTQTQVEQAQFFLTAHSRAPETTLFGTPKVACWPINAALSPALAAGTNTPYASTFDNLVAFCSTLNGTASTAGGTSTAPGGSNQQVYYFQRQNKDSLTNDYLNIPRNQTLFTYLHTLMNTQVPGFGGNLANKFGTDSDQILTEIFDYIRSTNLNDLNLTTETAYPYYQYGSGGTTHGFGVAEVAPITITSPSGAATRGFGRFTTISEASLWLICTADPSIAAAGLTPASNSTNNLTIPAGVTLANTATYKQIVIEAALVLDPFTPMNGVTPMRPDINILVSGLDQWTIEGNDDNAATSLGFPSLSQQTTSNAGVYQLGGSPSNVGGMYNEGGFMGTSWALASRCVRARNSNLLTLDTNFNSSLDGASGPLNEQYPFVSQPVAVKVYKASPTLTFSGGTITVTIQQRTNGTIQSASPSTPGATIQTLVINFPSTTLPLPILPTSTTANDAIYWTFQAGGCGIVNQGRLSTTNAGGETPPTFLTGNDIIYSVVPAQSNGSSLQTLDPRFVALMASDTNDVLFSKHPWYDGVHTLANTLMPTPGEGLDEVLNGTTFADDPDSTNTLANIGSGNYYPWKNWPCPKVPYPAPDAIANGDWDNGLGSMSDGGYVNEPDQGTIMKGSSTEPYYTDGINATLNYTSPNRMMPSPGMFGSLPTTFLRSLANNFTGAHQQGWQTLLFRRQPTHPSYVNSPSSYNASGSTATTGLGNGLFSNAPDYLMMDLFWMPVVQPYAISEAFSTAGKINMNYQVIPFTYLERQTGLYAVLKHESVIAVPTADYKVYKGEYTAILTSTPTQYTYRLPIQIAPTLQQFLNRFDNSDNTGLYAYRTPAEICDVNLIPNDPNYSSSLSVTLGTNDTGGSTDSQIDSTMATYWSTHTLTGDNCRERPYTTIYPKLTTRSNTFRVHYRVQTLKQIPSSTPGNWTEGTDLITSEGRGSVLIERYLDANDTTIPDYASSSTLSTTLSTGPTIESHYQFRVISINRFPP